VAVEQSTDAAPIPTIRPGVFFHTPAPLPRGRHNLSREQVTAAQRERLLVAMTELLAAHGYRGFRPTDVACRAGVSLAAFYACFDNKDACVFAGYDRFIEVLLGKLAAVDAEGLDRPGLVHAVVGSYLDTLGSDPVVARAYQVEIDALGPPARARRRQALTLFAHHIRELVERTATAGAVDLPWSAYIGTVYAARQLASDALEAEGEPDLSALGDDLEAWLGDVFRQRSA
jgi:AcrR family transcriptional regulator